MILDVIIPSGFMMQGAILGAIAAILIVKFRDGKTYRGK